MKGMKIIMVTLISIFGATTTLAALSPPKGWYIDGNVGLSNVDNTSFGNGTKLETNTNSFGLNVNAGYKFFPYFALEMGYTRYARENIQFNGATVAKLNPSAYDISTKAILPVQNSGFEFFAKVGVARLLSKVTINDQNSINVNGLTVTSGTTKVTGVYYGVGGEYYFWPTTGVHLSWTEIIGNNQTGNPMLIALGITHIFNW